MTDKLRELIELGKSVDVICAEVDKSNAKKQEVYKAGLAEQWKSMVDDLTSLLPAVEAINFDNYIIFGDYIVRYERNSNGNIGISVYYNVERHFAMDCPVSKDKGKYDFESWYEKWPLRTEWLLDNWEELYAGILEELEKRISYEIKRKIRERERKTEQMDKKLAEQEERRKSNDRS